METINTEEAQAGIYPRAGSAVYMAARAASIVLHPFVVPVYAMLIFMYGNTILALASPRTKLFLLAVVTLNALVIPVIAIGLLRWLGMISDLSFEKRYDRTVAMAIVALCYGLCVFMVSDLVFGFIVRKFFIAAFCCAMAALIITPFWKISLHMIAMGAVTALFAVYTLAGIMSGFIPLMVTIILAGALGSARLYLGRHTPAQVATGFLTGFVTASAGIFFL